MRMIKIPACSYARFEAIRDVILDHVPFALINEIFQKSKSVAFFYFWDVEYIPMTLRSFIVQPPADREPMDELLRSLELV